MSDRAMVRLLLGSILAVGAVAAYGIKGAGLSDVLKDHYPVAAAESYWLHKFQYERNVGKHACRADTGEYAGTVRGAYYREWAPTNGGRERRWLYSVEVAATVPVGPERRTQRVVGLSIGPANAWATTDGKCRDGRP